MTDTINCPLCNNENTTSYNFPQCTRFTCPECGIFQMNTFNNKPNLSDYDKLLLSRYYSMLDPLDNKRLFILAGNNYKEITQSINYPVDLLEKINGVVNYFRHNTKIFGKELEINIDKDFRLFFCFNSEELNEILKYLIANNYIAKNGNKYKLTVEGFIYYQKNIIPENKSHQAFVAMWFNRDENLEKRHFNMDKVYAQAIKPAIEAENKYASIKIDCVEHCNDINDEMISQIKKSKFMLADLTGYRGGVYWEAGFATGLNIPIIYTCNEHWLHTNEELNIEGVHFDVNHKNIILWDYENLEDFKEKIIKRINAVIV